MKIIPMTLCLVIEGEKVLLGYKKRGFGEGWWNGFGGKVEMNESIEAAVLREVEEEAGIRLREVFKKGLLEFTFSDRPGEILIGHIYRGEGVEGQPRESEEMSPEWFHLHEIPYDYMWPADRFWLPALLEGKEFKGKIHFDEKKEIVSKEIVFIGEEMKSSNLFE